MEVSSCGGEQRVIEPPKSAREPENTLPETLMPTIGRVQKGSGRLASSSGMEGHRREKKKLQSKKKHTTDGQSPLSFLRRHNVSVMWCDEMCRRPCKQSEEARPRLFISLLLYHRKYWTTINGRWA